MMRHAKLRNLVPLIVLSLLVVPQLVQGEEAAVGKTTTATFSVGSYDRFNACYRDRNIDVETQRGVVMLAPTEYITHEVGNKISKTTLKGGTIARVVFDLGAGSASKAELCLFGSAGQAKLNGVPLSFQNSQFGGWSIAQVDGKSLKRGANELQLRDLTIAWDRETAPPKNSFVSTDGGQRWGPADGEFLARLRLFRRPPQGVITSEVIDLACPSEKDLICPLLTVRDVRFRMETEAPGGTSIALEARSGDSLVPDANWTDWATAEKIKPARYVQWRATLKTDNRAVTPVLKDVQVKVETDVLADPKDQGLSVKVADNPKVVRSSYPYALQVPSRNLTTLRTKWNLDQIVAPGKTELDKFVLLRNWVRRQWPHNDNGSGERTWNAIEILSAPDDHHGMCVHYGTTFAQCALALGYNARQIILSGHFVADVWSNEYRKWVLMDVECVQKEGWDRYGTALYWDAKSKQPMSSLDLHRAVVGNSVQNIVQRFYLTDGGGGYTLNERQYGPEEYGNFRRFAYPERNNYLDQLEPWEEYHGQDHYHADSHLWWKDSALEISPEFTWTTNREGDIDWTVNTVHFTLTATEDPSKLDVMLDTVTPNLKEFQYRIGEGKGTSLKGEGDDPHSRRAQFTWNLNNGENRIEVRPVNLFGREGVVSSVVVVKQ